MKATAEIQVIPLGAGVSVRREVRRAHDLLAESGLIIETHASGTDVEGDLAQILRAVEHVHEALHAEGTVRLLSVVKLETRTRSRRSPASGSDRGISGRRATAVRPGDAHAAGGPDRDRRQMTALMQEDLR